VLIHRNPIEVGSANAGKAHNFFRRNPALDVRGNYVAMSKPQRPAEPLGIERARVALSRSRQVPRVHPVIVRPPVAAELPRRPV
jgi:hypothetical protein